MRMYKSAALLLSVTYLLLGNVNAETVTISVESFAQIQARYENLELITSLQNPTAYLEENSRSPEENIYLKSLMLNRLALVKEPTLEQREWLKVQTQNTDTLNIPSVEHANQSLVIAHVANTANMVDMHWQAYAMQKEFNQRWESGSWLWERYFLNQNRISTMAMTFWLDDMSESNVQLLAESYLKEGLKYDVDNNYQLSLLATRAPSTELFGVLWQRPSDAYSHRVLKDIIDKGKNVEEIINATQNPKLSSQALFSLVKSHSEQSNVQSFLREAIESKRLSSATLGTLSLLGDDRFRSQLLSDYQQKPTTEFTRQVVKQLGGEIE